VACSRAAARSLSAWLGTHEPALREALEQWLAAVMAPSAGERWADLVSLAPEHPLWRPRVYVPLLTRAWLFRRVSERVVFHAVPAYLAANKSRVQAFEAAWHRHVSPGRALYAQDPRAAAILEVQRGENPFATTAQLRTL
jgi:hypothetical protein